MVSICHFFPTEEALTYRIQAAHQVITREVLSAVVTASSTMQPSPRDFYRVSIWGPTKDCQSPFSTLTIIMETGVSVPPNLGSGSRRIKRADSCVSSRSAGNILLGSQRSLCISPCGGRLSLYGFPHYNAILVTILLQILRELRQRKAWAMV